MFFIIIIWSSLLSSPGLIHEEYLKNEIKNLGRFISVMKFRPLIWRTSHPFVVGKSYSHVVCPAIIVNVNKYNDVKHLMQILLSTLSDKSFAETV